MPCQGRLKGFSLIEVMAATGILAIVCSSVLVVVNRSMVAAANSKLKMQAFEVAREKMEELLTSDTASEMAAYGISEQYPGIRWQTVVEPFYEPVGQRVWLRAVCTAQYYDAEGAEQKVELTHWLASLSKKQATKMMQTFKQMQEAGLIEPPAPEQAPTDTQPTTPETSTPSRPPRMTPESLKGTAFEFLIPMLFPETQSGE